MSIDRLSSGMSRLYFFLFYMKRVTTLCRSMARPVIAGTEDIVGALVTWLQWIESIHLIFSPFIARERGTEKSVDYKEKGNICFVSILLIMHLSYRVMYK